MLQRELATRGALRLLYLLGHEARDVDADAMKAETGFRARHASAFERVAVFSDEAWMKPALQALSFLMPGKAKAFAVRDLAAAKARLAEPAEPAT